MKDLETDVSPDQYAELVLSVLRGVTAKYGCLAIVGANNLTVTRGTVAFVEAKGRRWLFTAKHVVDGLFARAEELTLIRARHPDEPSLPHHLKVTRAALKWSSEPLDLAILEAPVELNGVSDVDWFNLATGRTVIEGLRQKWDKTRTPYLTLAFGFPNFGRLNGEFTSGEKIELLTMPSAPASIVSLDRAPDGKSSMRLELTFDGPVPPSNPTPLGQQIYEVLRDNPPTTEKDLGGSGGPLIVPGMNGASEIIAIITAGSAMKIEDGPDVLFLFGTPIDEINLSWL